MAYSLSKTRCLLFRDSSIQLPSQLLTVLYRTAAISKLMIVSLPF